MQKTGRHNTICHFGIIVAVMFIVACNKTEDIHPETEPTIGFGVDMPTYTPKTKSTRTMITSVEQLRNSGFSVWGGNEDNVTLFDGRIVYWVEEEHQGWTYDNPEIWTYDNYNFSAVFPTTINATYTLPNTLTIEDYSVNEHPYIDLLMAAASNHAYPNDGSTVRLHFNHALTAVNFVFKLKEGFSYVNTYKVTGVRWSNIYTQGRFTLNSDNTITPSTTGNTGATNTITAFTGTTFTATSVMESEFQFVIPQERTNATLTFTIEINGESKEITKNIAVKWEAGRRYTYSITLDPFEITVETTPWEIPYMEEIIIQ